MIKSQSYVLLILVFLMILTGCRKKNTYYFSIDGKNKTAIKAISDSAAYLKAFLNFQITRKLYRDEKAFYPNVKRKEPICFTLYNNENNDITHKVNFIKKDSLEKDISRRVFGLKNYFLDEVEKQKMVE